MKISNKIKKFISCILTVGMVMSLVPSVSMAAQSTTYIDPADKWIEANNRTNEFDINATVTTETVYCPNCDMETSHLTYRVPEYTKSGETALNRGVEYSGQG